MQTLKSYEGFRAGAPVKTAAAAPRMQAAFRRMPLKIEAARVGGVEIPNQKRVEFSLQYIYGIGHTTAKAILTETVRDSQHHPLKTYITSTTFFVILNDIHFAVFLTRFSDQFFSSGH